MAYTIPTTEPLSPRAGDTWQWTRSLSDFPAPGWVLTYHAWNSSAAITITASADGTDHSVSVPSATTGAYTAGRYEWVARVTDGASDYTIGSGIWQVLPAVGAAMDTRSHARKMLEALDALIEGRATDGDIDVVRQSINDRTVERDMGQLLALRAKYAQMVASENQAAALARGDQSGRHVRVRFVS